ncbi:MAG: hypothetical protein ACJAZI_000800 [Cycloclasticus sp.]|jgi:hypothetical protein
MKSNYLFILALLTLLSFNVNAHGTSKSQAEQALQTADDLLAKTITAGHQWTTIKPLIDQSKKALKTKDFGTSISLANEAIEQAKLALMQAENEKTNWLHSLPK